MLQNPSELNFSLNIISLGELSTSLGLSQNWIFYPTIEFEIFGAEISHQGEALERLMNLVPCWRSSTGKIRVFLEVFFAKAAILMNALKLLEVKGDPSFERVEGRDTGGRRG